jgi:peptidoglycan/xylan/chitin deacetylase (PgdA/CDA1 family)
MSSLKDRAKALSYTFGSLGCYHLLFHRHRLTVAMFHRVLPRSAPAWSAADEAYTIDTEIFDQCLGFFARHYTVVSLDQVLAANAGGPPLPGWPLLITFDDGWADTLAYAAPLLAKRNLPAVCFVVSNVLDDPTERWWQDSFGYAWRAQRAQIDSLKATWSAPGMLPAATTQSNPYLMGLAMMSDLAPSDRSAMLDQWLAGLPCQAPRQMLTAAEVPALVRTGIAVGAHGASHIPLTLSRDPDAEMADARTRLQEVLTGSPQSDVTTLSFPHGRFDAEIIRKARACGYKMMFTSAPHLTELTGGRPASDVIGRIEVVARHVAPDGQFRPDLLACQMFLRPAFRTPTEAVAPGIAAAC